MKTDIYNFKTTDNIDEIKDEAYEKGFRPAMEFRLNSLKLITLWSKPCKIS